MPAKLMVSYTPENSADNPLLKQDRRKDSIFE